MLLDLEGHLDMAPHLSLLGVARVGPSVANFAGYLPDPIVYRALFLKSFI
jgi:hypothetical protein